MKRWMAALPLAGLLAFAVVAWVQLRQPPEQIEAETPTVVRMAPERAFPLIDATGDLRFNPPPDGQPAVVNLFASWCGPCEVEHPYLVDLAEQGAPLYGILYKDTPDNGRKFLTRLGDPYRAVGEDPSGQGGLDFGLSGVPETFVIDGNGQVQLHVAGPLNPERADQILKALKQMSSR